MKIKKTHKVRTAVIFFALALAFNAYSQQDLTINTMPIIPQSSYTNPAFKPIPKWYIGFPALSSVYVGVGHSGFAYDDLFHLNTVDDSLQLTDQKMINKLGKVNYLSTHASEEILCFGFKARKSYFSFSYGIKANVQFSYPRDLIKLADKGTGQFVGGTADFSGIGVNASLYKEFAIGFSRDVKIFNQNFTLGARVKILRGLMNVYNKPNNITMGINSDDFAYTANANGTINMTVPDSMAIMLDHLGDSTYNKGGGNLDAQKFIFNPTNKGVGIDLGASYKLNDKWTFGASVLDLGYINWQTGSGSSVRNYAISSSNFVFDGVDLSQFIGVSDSVQKIKQKEMLDSLGKYFKVNTTKNGYKAPLGTKFYLTAEYSLTKHDIAGLLLHGEMLNGVLHPSATVSYNKWFCNMFSASLSYSIVNRSYSNVGFGMALNLGPWQIYLLTDNFYCLLKPETTQTINLHFGMNFIFGYRAKKPDASLYQETP